MERGAVMARLKGFATSQMLIGQPVTMETRFRSYSDTATICCENRSSKTDPSPSASIFSSQNCFSNPPCTSATNAIQFTHQLGAKLTDTHTHTHTHTHIHSGFRLHLSPVRGITRGPQLHISQQC